MLPKAVYFVFNFKLMDCLEIFLYHRWFSLVGNIVYCDPWIKDKWFWFKSYLERQTALICANKIFSNIPIYCFNCTYFFFCMLCKSAQNVVLCSNLILISLCQNLLFKIFYLWFPNQIPSSHYFSIISSALLCRGMGNNCRNKTCIIITHSICLIDW